MSIYYLQRKWRYDKETKRSKLVRVEAYLDGSDELPLLFNSVDEAKKTLFDSTIIDWDGCIIYKPVLLYGIEGLPFNKYIWENICHYSYNNLGDAVNQAKRFHEDPHWIYEKIRVVDNKDKVYITFPI